MLFYYFYFFPTAIHRNVLQVTAFFQVCEQRYNHYYNFNPNFICYFTRKIKRSFNQNYINYRQVIMINELRKKDPEEDIN